MKKKSITFILLFFGFLYAGYMPTFHQFKAWHDVTTGMTSWPVYKIPNNTIEVDGILDEARWDDAQGIFITGDTCWNEMRIQKPICWTGLADFVACWRVLYDDQNLYVACQVFDERHTEGKAGTSWKLTDAIELSIIKPNSLFSRPFPYNIVDSTGFYSYTLKQIWRRFIVESGLIGMDRKVGRGFNDTTRYPGDISVTGWEQTVPEGSLDLGGIYSAAYPINDSIVKRRYPNAWGMEIKIPLTVLFGANFEPAHPVEGVKFKMNPKVFDADSSSYFFSEMGMERSVYSWWAYNNFSDTLGDSARFAPAYYPWFVFAGTRNSQTVSFTLPDEVNLYCGHTFDYYADSTIRLLPDSSNAVESSIPLSNGLTLGATPNPFQGLTQIRFGLPIADAANLSIYNVSGTLVRDFGSRVYASGQHTVTWHGTVPGVYFVKLNAGGKNLTQKMTLLK